MITLEPIREQDSDWDPIEETLIKLFKREIYLPLIAEVQKKEFTLKNSIDKLAEAILTRRIEFYRGQFTGQFSAALSRELYKIGAKRDARHGCFRIPFSKLPLSIRLSISQSETRFDSVLRAIDRKIGKILPGNIADSFSVEDMFDKILWRVDKRLRGTLKGIAIAPELTPNQRKRIAGEWTDNMKKYIQEWTEKEIVQLRKRVQDHVLSGRRYEDLVKTISSSYGVAKSKAKFLARQETGLLMAKFKETRYQEAGIDEYYWVCVAGSPKHPVRPMHKALAEKSKRGTIFKFSDPPVTAPDGRRNNPGEDYNCRCYARPIVRFK